MSLADKISKLSVGDSGGPALECNAVPCLSLDIFFLFLVSSSIFLKVLLGSIFVDVFGCVLSLNLR